MDPNSFLSSEVSVKLNDGSFIVGQLSSLDGYMNVVISNAKELSASREEVKSHKETFIRGNNVLYVAKS